MNMVVTLGLKGGTESMKKIKPEEEYGENKTKQPMKKRAPEELGESSLNSRNEKIRKKSDREKSLPVKRRSAEHSL